MNEGRAWKLAMHFRNLRNIKLLRNIRLNQWIARGKINSSAELDEITKEILKNQLRNYFFLSRYLWKPEKISELITLGKTAEDIMRQRPSSSTGTILACTHLSNFDIFLMYFGQLGYFA